MIKLYYKFINNQVDILIIVRLLQLELIAHE
jgi:hypothetical protein